MLSQDSFQSHDIISLNFKSDNSVPLVLFNLIGEQLEIFCAADLILNTRPQVFSVLN